MIRRLSYASSHGCTGITNWDARDLGRRTADGAKVDFVDIAHDDEEQ